LININSTLFNIILYAICGKDCDVLNVEIGDEVYIKCKNFLLYKKYSTYDKIIYKKY